MRWAPLRQTGLFIAVLTSFTPLSSVITNPLTGAVSSLQQANIFDEQNNTKLQSSDQKQQKRAEQWGNEKEHLSACSLFTVASGEIR